MVRKVGGFTFQELNLAIDDIKKTGEHGADLSYDFVNRPAYHHALATGDTEFLRLTLNTALRQGLQPISLVHALQNHDEVTYELVHFAATHRDEIFHFRGTDVTGAELAIRIRAELIERLTGNAAPYNDIFTTNGIASTTATIVSGLTGRHGHIRAQQAARRAGQTSTPAAGDVQRAATWCIRFLRLGPLRDADAGAIQGCTAH